MKKNDDIFSALVELVFALAVFLEALKNADLRGKILNIIRTLKKENKLTIKVEFWLPTVPILMFFFWFLTSYMPLNKELALFSAVL